MMAGVERLSAVLSVSSVCSSVTLSVRVKQCLFSRNEINHAVFPRSPPLASPESAEGADQPAKILRGNCLLVHKHKARVIYPGLSPPFEEWPDGFLIIRNKGESFLGSFRQKDPVLRA